MKENKLIKILIPIVAVVVILESVILVSNLSKGSTNVAVDENSETQPTELVEEVKAPVADFVFATDTKEMKVGKSYEVTLNLVGKTALALDAIETYIKFDPSLVAVSKMVSGNTLPKATLAKVDSKAGLVSNIFLIREKEGYAVKANEITKILSFTVTPKNEGLINLELITSSPDKKSVTMIVDTATSEAMPFLSNKLEINATK